MHTRFMWATRTSEISNACSVFSRAIWHRFIISIRLMEVMSSNAVLKSSATSAAAFSYDMMGSKISEMPLGAFFFLLFCSSSPSSSTSSPPLSLCLSLSLALKYGKTFQRLSKRSGSVEVKNCSRKTNKVKDPTSLFFSSFFYTSMRRRQMLEEKTRATWE